MASISPLRTQASPDFVSKLPLNISQDIFSRCTHKDAFVLRGVNQNWNRVLSRLPGGPWQNVVLQSARDLISFRNLLRANATNMTNWLNLRNLTITPFSKDVDSTGACELLIREVLQLLALIKCDTIESVTIEFEYLARENVNILKLLLELLMLNGRTCRSITLLNCYELSSRLLYWIMTTFTQLKVLNIHQNNHTTSVFDRKRMGAVPYNGRYVLKQARFTGYRFLENMDTIMEYLSHCPMLTSLELQVSLPNDQQTLTGSRYQSIKNHCPHLRVLRLDFGWDWVLAEYSHQAPAEFYYAKDIDHICGTFAVSRDPFRKAPTLPDLPWTAIAINFNKGEFAARPWLWTVIHDRMPKLHTIRLVGHENTKQFTRVNRAILEKASHLMIADCAGQSVLQSLISTIPHKRGRTRDTVKIVTLQNMTKCDLYVNLWDKLPNLEKMNIIDCTLLHGGQWYADSKKTQAREIYLKQSIGCADINLTAWLQSFAINLDLSVLKISGVRGLNSNDLRLGAELINTLVYLEIENCEPELTLTDLVLVDSVLSGRGGSVKVRK